MSAISTGFMGSSKEVLLLVFEASLLDPLLERLGWCEAVRSYLQEMMMILYHQKIMYMFLLYRQNVGAELLTLG